MVSLGGAPSSSDERNENWPSQEQAADPAPSARESVLIEDRLFRDVRVPDEEVLRERDVGPEDGEARRELAEVVTVLDGADACEQPRLLERRW